jgi:hypothetical protein
MNAYTSADGPQTEEEWRQFFTKREQERRAIDDGVLYESTTENTAMKTYEEKYNRSAAHLEFTLGAIVVLVLCFGVAGTLDYDSQPAMLRKDTVQAQVQLFITECEKPPGGAAVVFHPDADVLEVHCMGGSQRARKFPATPTN